MVTSFKFASLFTVIEFVFFKVPVKVNSSPTFALPEFVKSLPVTEPVTSKEPLFVIKSSVSVLPSISISPLLVIF